MFARKLGVWTIRCLLVWQSVGRPRFACAALAFLRSGSIHDDGVFGFFQRLQRKLNEAVGPGEGAVIARLSASTPDCCFHPTRERSGIPELHLESGKNDTIRSRPAYPRSLREQSKRFENSAHRNPLWASVVHVKIVMRRVDSQSLSCVALALGRFSGSFEQRRGGREDSGVPHARGKRQTDVFERPGELAVEV
jgi:hypothetical protein